MCGIREISVFCSSGEILQKPLFFWNFSLRSTKKNTDLRLENRRRPSWFACTLHKIAQVNVFSEFPVPHAMRMKMGSKWGFQVPKSTPKTYPKAVLKASVPWWFAFLKLRRVHCSLFVGKRSTVLWQQERVRLSSRKCYFSVFRVFFTNAA